MQRPILLIYLVQTAASRTRRALGSRKLIGCRICLHAQSVSVVTLGSLIHIQDSHSLTRMTCTRNLMPKRTSSCKSADASTFSFSTSWATIRPSVAPHDLSKQKKNRALPLRRTSFFCLFHWVLWFHSNHTAGNIQVLVRNQPRSLPR